MGISCFEQSIVRWQREISFCFSSGGTKEEGELIFNRSKHRKTKDEEENNNWIEVLAVQLFVQTQKLINMHGALWLFFHKSRYNKNMWRTFLSDMAACSQSELCWLMGVSDGFGSFGRSPLKGKRKSVSESLPNGSRNIIIFLLQLAERLEVYQEESSMIEIINIRFGCTTHKKSEGEMKRDEQQKRIIMEHRRSLFEMIIKRCCWLLFGAKKVLLLLAGWSE
jgi:hypothetical protein